MKISKAVIVLSLLTAFFGLIQAGAGIFSTGGSGPFSFTTLHGQIVQMNGQGIYTYDTFFKAPIYRGTDAVMLVVCLPLLLAAVLRYRRGSLRGGLLLVSILAFTLYNAASISLGVAYNNLFLVYVAYFSASLFAFVLAYRSVNVDTLAARVGPGAPHGGIAALMFVSGLALLFAWLGDIVTPLLRGGVPDIGSYTTEVTYVIDLGIIVPAAVLTGILVLRRAPLGYLLSSIMLIVLSIVGLLVATQTVFQMMAGITLPIGQFIGKAGSFMVLAAIALWLVLRFFRSLTGPAVR